jgi:hypothetical protein
VIRLVALSVLALVALVLGGVALARALVSMRAERKRKRAVLDRQREADLREQAQRRQAREQAKDALGYPPVMSNTPGVTLYAAVKADLEAFDARRKAEDARDIEDARAALADPENRPALADLRWTWTTGGYVETDNTGAQARTWTTTIENSQPVLVPEPARSHPLGWTVVALPGGVLCAVSVDTVYHSRHAVDRYDSPSRAWVRLTRGERLWREAVAALGMEA